jgi:hypothetical protein
MSFPSHLISQHEEEHCSFYEDEPDPDRNRGPPRSLRQPEVDFYAVFESDGNQSLDVDEVVYFSDESIDSIDAKPKAKPKTKSERKPEPKVTKSIAHTEIKVREHFRKKPKARNIDKKASPKGSMSWDHSTFKFVVDCQKQNIEFYKEKNAENPERLKEKNAWDDFWKKGAKTKKRKKALTVEETKRRRRVKKRKKFQKDFFSMKKCVVRKWREDPDLLYGDIYDENYPEQEDLGIGAYDTIKNCGIIPDLK